MNRIRVAFPVWIIPPREFALQQMKNAINNIDDISSYAFQPLKFVEGLLSADYCRKIYIKLTLIGFDKKYYLRIAPPEDFRSDSTFKLLKGLPTSQDFQIEIDGKKLITDIGNAIQYGDSEDEIVTKDEADLMQEILNKLTENVDEFN